MIRRAEASQKRVTITSVNPTAIFCLELLVRGCAAPLSALGGWLRSKSSGPMLYCYSWDPEAKQFVRYRIAPPGFAKGYTTGTNIPA
jgi:hypothetical protein